MSTALKILVIGSDARTDAFVQKLFQSSHGAVIYAAPGNLGTQKYAINVPFESIEQIRDFALKEAVDITVVMPEAPLVDGIVDQFAEAGLYVFGPSKAAAQLEGSKSFMKHICSTYGVPTAGYTVCDRFGLAFKLVEDHSLPMVIKYDGLAAGKGVTVCKTFVEARKALEEIFLQDKFKDKNPKAVIEDYLPGQESSFMCFVDHNGNIAPLASAQDHKQIFDGDQGPMTGGMGAYSPAAIMTESIQAQAMVMARKIVDGMKKEGTPFTGVLYVGLMIVGDKAYALECNVRFGDPECQVLMMRLKNDLVGVLLAAKAGHLNEIELQWSDEVALTVVLASAGYPDSASKGDKISIDYNLLHLHQATLFHAGTKMDNGQLVTNGGRVANLAVMGASVEDAREAVYAAIDDGGVSFPGMQFRHDIGNRPKNV